MRIILIDNYDSFTWNIVHYLEQCGCEVSVLQNDAALAPEWEKFDACVISPGPGMPNESGCLLEWIEQIPDEMPTMGICLGLQALVVESGGQLQQLTQPLHGVQTKIRRAEPTSVWKNLPEVCSVGHYHSWIADSAELPMEWRIAYVDEHSRIMAIEHEHLPRCAVQFHPESILSENGMLWISEWILSLSNSCYL
jgi:anthranilate synthase/aminodeoxychorismate synthase-like glutamine amidotransferase